MSHVNIRVDPSLPEDAGGADDSVLRVRPGFALEAQCFLKVERNHRLLGVLQHEVAQSTDRDLVAISRRSGSLSACGWRESTSSLRRRDKLIEQIVGFHAKSLAAADLDVGARLVFFAQARIPVRRRSAG